MRYDELMKNLKNDIISGQKPDFKSILDFEKDIRNDSSLTSDKKMELLSQLYKIKKEQYYNVMSKWDVFYKEIQLYDSIPKTLKVIEYINNHLDSMLNEKQLEKLEEDYFLAIKELHNEDNNNNIELSVKSKIINEIEKRIKVYKTRLERCLIQSVEFGAWIKSIRDDKGLSLTEVSKRCGISASYINRIENGRRGTPSILVAEKLAQGLDIEKNVMFEKLGLETNTSSNKFDLMNLLTDNDKEILFKGKKLDIEAKEKILEFISSNL